MAKARRAVGKDDLRGLRELRKEGAFKRFVVASLEPRPRVVDGIEILPWRDFVERLWSGGFDQPPTATTRSDSTTWARMLAPSAAPAEGRIVLQFCDDFQTNPRKRPQNRPLRSGL